MRLAAVYDVHGNLPALEAVLEDIRRAAVDLVVVGGDLVPGPMPRETLSCLLELDIPVRFIQGNGEIDALAEIVGTGAIRVPQQFREVVRWCAGQFHPEHKQLIAGWPQTLRVEVDGFGPILFCHATPRDDNEIFTRLTSEERLLPIFDGLNVSLVVCGHTHMQFDRMIGKTRVVNAGSVGMAFGKSGADWLLLDPEIRFRCTYYDLIRAAECIRKTEYPQAEEFSAHYILNHPTEERMLDAFTRAELR